MQTELPGYLQLSFFGRNRGDFGKNNQSLGVASHSC